MPRMDPKKLLNCLSVVLLPNGGIKSTDEVERLAKLMTQYSKKLVSKCIYIQILKCTETNLLDIFMGSGGWRLLHMWLTEGIAAKNWPLVKELLELLLLCPVDIDRLKSNNCPKLVKELSKDENDFVIKALASKLVEQWLKTVKGEQSHPVSISDIPKIVSETCNEIKSHGMLEGSNDARDNDDTKMSEIQTDKKFDYSETNIDETTHSNSIENVSDVTDEKSDTNKEFETLPVLKISLKNGKQVLTQVDENSKSSESSELKAEINESNKSKNKEKRSNDSSKSSSSKHSSKSKSSSDRHKKESRHSSSSKDKDKKRDKDRHASSSSSSKSKSSSSSSSSSSKKTSSSSSRSKDEMKSETSIDKEKSKDKEKKVFDKEKSSLEQAGKPLSPSIKKLGKIPKLGEVKREKPSISIEVRKPEDPKPKTVKTFHSKFRKHGLEEEVQPPPSRASVLTKKQLPPLPPTVSIPKRPSPIHNESPPEKKPKTIEIEKPGAIKLIPPKPKPMVLQESDLFMDALNASTTNKKEPKKRKRRMSGSKDGTSNESSPPNTPTNEGKSVPPRFYQDTLDEEESKKKITEKEGDLTQNEEKENNVNEIEEQINLEPHTRTVNGLKGVLCYHRRKGPKKSIKWKPDSELEEIQYFELDETERVNVTKTFTDMKNLEMIHEREAFQKARNLTNDDVMEEKTVWKNLIFVDCGDQVVVEYGKNSKEKDIQAIRQKGTLQPLYFHKSMIPDSPFEPDLETHTYSEPTPIPLDDVTGNVSDFRNMPWPEPKGHPPLNNTNLNVPPMFPTNIPQFPNNFPPNQFPAGPGFQGQPLLPGDWQNNVPPVMPNGLPGSMGPPVMPPNGMSPANMPRMMVPNENMMLSQKMFGGPNPMFPGPPDGFNMPQNMFPGDFNMPGPQGPTGPDSFSVPNNFRGAMRGRAPNGHWRGNGGFDGPPRGRGGNRGGRKAVCIHFQRKGSCRQGDSCSFLHPGVNCPY